MIPVRYSDLWEQLRARLNTTRLATMLGGSNRVYLEGEDYSQPEGPEDRQWARVVLSATTTLWPVTEAQDKFIKFAFLVRVEAGKFTRPGYSPQKYLEAVLDEVFREMQSWELPFTAYSFGVFPLFLARGPEPMPLWDDARGLFMLSVVYRTELTRPTANSLATYDQLNTVGAEAVSGYAIPAALVIDSTPTTVSPPTPMGRFIMQGDSFTYRDFEPEGSMAIVMAALLPGVVVNHGHSGYTIQQLRDLAPTEVDVGRLPDDVLGFSCFINDLDAADVAALGAGTYAKFNSYMADRLAAGWPASRLFVWLETPNGDPADTARAAAWHNLNMLVTARCAALGAPCVNLEGRLHIGTWGDQANLEYFHNTFPFGGTDLVHHPTFSAAALLGGVFYDVLASASLITRSTAMPPTPTFDVGTPWTAPQLAGFINGTSWSVTGDGFAYYPGGSVGPNQIFRDVTAAGVDATVQFTVRKWVDLAVYLRYVDGNNHVMFRLTGGNAYVFEVIGGVATQIAYLPFQPTSDGATLWYYEFSVHGNTASARRNGYGMPDNATGATAYPLVASTTAGQWSLWQPASADTAEFGAIVYVPGPRSAYVGDTLVTLPIIPAGFSYVGPSTQNLVLAQVRKGGRVLAGRTVTFASATAGGQPAATFPAGARVVTDANGIALVPVVVGATTDTWHYVDAYVDGLPAGRTTLKTP